MKNYPRFEQPQPVPGPIHPLSIGSLISFGVSVVLYLIAYNVLLMASDGIWLLPILCFLVAGMIALGGLLFNGSMLIMTACGLIGSPRRQRASLWFCFLLHLLPCACASSVAIYASLHQL